MHPIRKQRLIFIGALLALIAIAAGLALYALKQNINLFYTPSQILQESVSTERTIRVGGLVKKGSVHYAKVGNEVSFVITDTAHDLKINYQGLLPDLFREGQGIVAEGHLNKEGSFAATQVLAKHDEKYTPPQVADSLKNMPQGIKTT
jgi:cytochrome c-type biogenesis protein CcmE